MPHAGRPVRARRSDGPPIDSATLWMGVIFGVILLGCIIGIVAMMLPKAEKPVPQFTEGILPRQTGSPAGSPGGAAPAPPPVAAAKTPAAVPEPKVEKKAAPPSPAPEAATESAPQPPAGDAAAQAAPPPPADGAAPAPPGGGTEQAPAPEK